MSLRSHWSSSANSVPYLADTSARPDWTAQTSVDPTLPPTNFEVPLAIVAREVPSDDDSWNGVTAYDDRGKPDDA